MKRHQFHKYALTPADLDDQRREAILERLTQLSRGHRPRFDETPDGTLELLVEERLDRVATERVCDAVEEQLEYDLSAHETVHLGQRASQPVRRYEICLGYPHGGENPAL